MKKATLADLAKKATKDETISIRITSEEKTQLGLLAKELEDKISVNSIVGGLITMFVAAYKVHGVRVMDLSFGDDEEKDSKL